MSSSQPAPAIRYTAIESGRTIDLAAVAVPTLLLLMTQESSGQVDEVIAKVRERYPAKEDAMIANVVDVRTVPRLLRKIAEGMMAGRYKAGAKDLSPERDPRDWIFILPDWDGKLLKALAVDDVSKQIALAVVAPGGVLRGSYQGPDPATAALELLGG